MVSIRRVWPLLMIVLLCPLPVQAEEPVAQFLQGLRQRGDFELAVDYIEQCRERDRSGTPFSREARSLLLLESGITYSQASGLAVDPSLQLQFREQARTALREFMKTAPEHPRMMQAQSLLGSLLLEDGARVVMEGELVGAPEDRQRVIRIVIDESRGYLRQSRDRYHELWKQYPIYIPEDQWDLRAMKGAVEESYIRTQLDLAQCTYWEAQTWPDDSEESRKLCAQAGLEFEAIHQRYRSQTGGLFARLWQGRCFQEQGTAQGIRIALGIYAELLAHHGDSPTIETLKDRALKFRLTCLNTEHRRDYQLVIQEAEEWLTLASERSVTPIGIAIQWELCSALESKANMKHTGPTERLDLLEKAHARAYPLTWARGLYARRANALLQRVVPVLHEAGRSTETVKVPSG